MQDQQPSVERVVVDVRHTTASETVQCMGPHLNSVWSKYVVEAESRAFGLTGKQSLYLCRLCLTDCLQLAEAIGVG